ncbi:hypothetical protein [Streptomyces griseofuscus]|uniref:Uncharacterized protein n=1 Tax=Streptomyces griseofuscus TaxID=146922 RepID=A0A7H1Q3U0_9ACTN|nr:hypothetical protein [Streptomyces griseofuscus]QNT94970.1 hypothetical protein HEP81_04698 [Streptomyces griseofuscus]
MTTSEPVVAVELERLRGTVSTGFAEVKGSLSVLMERSTRTEADLARLRDETDRSIAMLSAEVEALKLRRWPLGVVGAVAGVAGAATGVISLFAR